MYSFVRKNGQRIRDRWLPLKWAAGLYLAGVLAHTGHHMSFYLHQGIGSSLFEGLSGAPTSLAWPADLIATLIAG